MGNKLTHIHEQNNLFSQDEISQTQNFNYLSKGIVQDPFSKTWKLKENIVQELFRSKSFRIGSFTLKSKEISPFYIDLRRIVSFPAFYRTTIKAYETLAQNLSYHRIAGLPLAGLPLAAGLSLKIEKPLIYPRINAKSHGTGNLIEGEYEENDTVLLIDDLITDGGSKKEAIDIMRNASLKVNDIIVLITREKSTTTALSHIGVKTHAFLHMNDILNIAKQKALIDEEDIRRIRNFLEQENS